MRRFFSENIEDDTIYLDQEESRHLQQVLRAKIGDLVEVVNGKGMLYECSIAELSKKQSVLSIQRSSVSTEDPVQLWMAVSPTKNINRWEWFLEKATEIGIGRISPIITKNSERKHIKQDRQVRILKEAMKQSQRLHLPILDEMMHFDAFIRNADFEEKFIAHCFDEEKEKLKLAHQKGKKALILIGPEGDFDPSEIEKAKSKGFKAVSLSENRLRTETAAIVACHTIDLLNA